MNDKLPYDHYDELNVHYVGETFAEFAKSDLDYETDRTDAGLFEVEETNRDVLDAVDAENSTDLREALREAERMRRLIEAAPEMYWLLKLLIEKANYDMSGQLWESRAKDALPDLDVDLDEVFPWLGERDPPPKKEDVL